MMEAKLIEIIASASGVGAESIDLNTRLDALPLDSLEFLELVLDLQEQFAVKIPDEYISHLNTVNDCLLCIQHLKLLQLAVQ